MSSIKVSELTAKTSPSGSEELLINDGGTSKKITIANLPDTDTVYTLPTATASVLGGIKVGTNLSIASGVLSSTDTNTTYTSSDFTHDSLSGVTANEHIDWTTDQGTTNIHAGNYTDTNTTYTASTGLTLTGTAFSVDNPYPTADETKLAGIESGATADQSNAEIKTAYEANADTNAFTDADHSKLDGIAAGATNVTNNNQLTNGAGYVTTDTNTTYSAGTGLDLTGTTFSVEPDLRDGITHVGRDTNDYIEIATDRIRFYINGVNVMSCDSSGNIIAKGNVSAYGTPI